MSRLIRWRPAAAVAVALALAAPAPALAHEDRHVHGYQMTVGWRDEPAFAGVRNAVQVILSTGSGAPVRDAGGGLTVQVLYAGRATPPMPLRPAFGASFGTPGEYDAPLVPTRPGAYGFHVRGSIGGTAIDESFTSSPSGFPGVEDDGSISFPVADPTRGEIAQRLERLGPRLDGARERADDAAGAATRATILAAVGVALAVVGLGMMAASRRRAPVARPQPERS
jgi:hypothetical protein